MRIPASGPITVAASCAAIFLPGSFIFGFPGVMAGYWQTAYQVGRGDVGQTIFFILAGAGIFMFVVGRLQNRIGTACTTVIGALLYCSAVMAVGYAGSMTGVYLWAFAAGSSSAFVYVPTLTVVQRWYPKWRGLTSGLVSMCFGLSGAISAPIYSLLLREFGFRSMTAAVGIGMAVVAVSLAPFIRPPVDDAPPPTAATGAVVTASAFQSLRTLSFWLLWVTFACVGAAGIAMVPLSTGFGTSLGLDKHQALVILMAFNITNGLSRFLSGFLSDMTGRKIIMGTAFGAAGLAYYLLPHTAGLVVPAALAAVIGYAFGTLFAVTAPLVSDCFGMQHFGSIFGLVFTAFGFISGAIGPWLGGYLLDLYPGNYSLVFGYLGTLLIGSALLIWFVTPRAECSF